MGVTYFTLGIAVAWLIDNAFQLRQRWRRRRREVPDRLWVQLHLVGQDDELLLVEAVRQGVDENGLHLYIVVVDDDRLVKGVSMPVLPAYTVVRVIARTGDSDPDERS